MKICAHCGYENWEPHVVKVKSLKVIFCDNCHTRIDNQPAQCDPLIGHSEQTTVNDPALSSLSTGKSNSIGILNSGGGEE